MARGDLSETCPDIFRAERRRWWPEFGDKEKRGVGEAEGMPGSWKQLCGFWNLF